MATEPQKSKEHPSTYFVQDRSNEDELTRLHIQDQLLIKGMGGVLSEQDKPDRFQRVLDVGCGTGDWLIMLAQQLPDATPLIGADISLRMVQYARDQAQTAGVSDRVEFHVMDALRMLEFPHSSFDLVNQRLGMSYLRTWDWPNLLQEYQRVTKPGGIIRITEGDIPTSNTPAFSTLYNLFNSALERAGHLFFPERDGVTRALESTMHQAGLLNLQTRVHLLEYRAGTLECQSWAENMKYFFRNALPFFRKWTQVPKEYDSIYQQAFQEMQQPDFVVTWRLLTCWGTNPSTPTKTVFDPH
ncbi:MAG: class I SAM-dependent methyltransferase [Ktedonobacteraceae bacterium]|nr:class I SAM-dependent methyltransferase [Ktedonobacteraceae bacterium]